MKEDLYDIPKNVAVCWEEDCTCSYVYTTDNENILLTHCRTRELGSHLWLDIPDPKWSSLAPIDVDTHRKAVLQGQELMKKLNIRDLFRPLH